MADQPTRKLAVLLHADVVGSTALVRLNETLAHQRIQDTFRRFAEIITRYSGTAHELRGDALVAEFPRASDAVSASLAFQADNGACNAELTDDVRPAVRVGIAMGEVVVADSTVTGEGVVLAQRLEQIAEPGGVCIQGAAYETVPKRLPFAYRSYGESTLKGFEEPVRVYVVALRAGESVPAPEAPGQSEKPALELPNKPSIAILPFTNMSGDAEQEYFSDGISEDIITDLSKISALFVIARNSSFVYKGEAVDVKKITRDLGVRYVLEGSVRKAANRVRITAQLIDGYTGGHMWADRYDRDMEDIFLVQDEVTQQIVEALRIRLNPDEKDRISGPSTRNVEAYDFTLRGRDLLYRFSPQNSAEAQTLFEKSIELDPEFSTAYSLLAVKACNDYTNGWNGATEETLRGGLLLAEKAVELDSSDPQAYWALAMTNMWNRNLDRAIVEIEKAVALDPNNSQAIGTRGYILSYADRAPEAIASLEKSMRLNPQYPNIYLHFLAHAYFVDGDYEQAVALLRRRIRLHPETDISRVLLASCCGHLGRHDEAREAWTGVFEINPDYSIDKKARVIPYQNPADWDRFVAGLNKAGLPD